MLASDALHEVLTLSEAAQLSAKLGRALDHNRLLHYARSGQMAARKSDGVWLTTRTALAHLIANLETEGRDRPQAPAEPVTLTPEIQAILEEIDQAHARLEARLSPDRKQALWDEMLPEAIYHTNRIEGNRLSLDQVRAIVAEEQATHEPDDGPS